jgi:hypothetical protein
MIVRPRQQGAKTARTLGACDPFHQSGDAEFSSSSSLNHHKVGEAISATITRTLYACVPLGTLS